MKKLLAGLFPLLLLLAAAAGSAAEGAGAEFGEIDRLLDRGRAIEAAQLLGDLAKKGGRRSEVLWRLARTGYELGRCCENPEDALEHFRRAEGFARRAIAAAPAGDEGYKWLAIALGGQAGVVGTREQVELSRGVKENIERALELDPADDISYLVLSRWHYKVSALGGLAQLAIRLVYGGLPEASLEAAEANLWKAIALQDRIAHRYNLAKVFDRMGRRHEALAQLRLALELPVTFPEEAEDLEKARRKLREWS